MKKPFRGIAPLLITMILIFFVAMLFSDRANTSEMDYSTLVAEIAADNVESIELASETNVAYVKLRGKKKKKYAVSFPSLKKTAKNFNEKRRR